MTEKEFENLMDRYIPYVVAVISKVAEQRLSMEEIEELASDIFTKLWEKRNKLKIQEGKEKAYIGASSRNYTLNLLRKKGLPELDDGSVFEEGEWKLSFTLDPNKNIKIFPTS